MKFRELSKILLVLLILVIFLNTVYANEDISVNENLTVSEDSDFNLPQETDDAALSNEENEVIPSSDNSLGMSQEDVLTSKSVTTSARCLNDTIYPYDVYRLEVMITNNGTEVMPVNSINATISGNRWTNTVLVGYEGDGWNNTSNDPKDPNFVYQKSLNVGESTYLYMDLYTPSSMNRSFTIVTSYKWFGNSITSTRKTFTVPIKGYTIEVEKELVNDSPIFKGDYVTFNMTVRNLDYEQHGKKWENVTLRDYFSFKYLEHVSSSFYDSNGNPVDMTCKDAYDGIIYSIDELGETITIIATFKAVSVGDTYNRLRLETVNRTATNNMPSSQKNITIYPHLTVDKSAKEEYLYSGDIAEFEIVVENIWKETISDFLITENIPKGLTFVSYEGDGWTKIKDYVFRHVSSLDPGKKTILNLKFKVNGNSKISTDPENPTVIKNEVRLTFEDNFNSFASAPIYVILPPANIIKKSLNQSVQLGDNVAFNITISNPYGDDNTVYHDLMVSDIVPDGLEFISCYGIDSNGKRIEIPYILKDGNVIFKIAEYSHNITICTTFKTTKTGNITNTAVYGLVDDDSEGEVYSEDSVYVYAQMIVEKACMNETIFSGDTVTYKVNITNNEDYDLTNIVLYEDYPEDLIYVGFEGDGWSKENDNSFKYAGILAPKESVSLYLSFNVSSDFKGRIKNNVTVKSDETKNVSSSEDIIVDAPRISLSKTYLKTNKVMLGDNISYAITVNCLNNPCYYNIDVTDIPAKGLEFLEAYYLDNDGNRIDASFTKNDDNITFHLDKINQSMRIVATFKTTQAGILKNTAVYKNITKTCLIRVDSVSMQFFKVTEDAMMLNEGSELYIQGDNVTYYISLTNTGGFDINNLTLTENPPEGLTFISFGGNNWEAIGENTYRYNQTFHHGNSTSLMLFYRIDGNVSGSLVNEVTASADEIDNLTSSFAIDVEKQDIKLDKVALNESVWVGDNVTFDIIVLNNSTGKVRPPDYWFPPIIGSAESEEDDILGYPEYVEDPSGYYYIYHDVQIIDTIPDGLEFLDCYALDEYGEKTPVTYRVEGNKVIFTLDSLYKIATIKATFKAVKGGNHTNVVSKDNVSAQDDVLVYYANMTVDKITNNKTVHKGEKVSFTIVVKNTGNSNLSEVFVKDEDFSDGLVYDSYVNNAGAGWKKDKNTYYYKGVLKPNETASFDIIFKTTKAGNFTNAVVAGSEHSDNVTAENVTEAIDGPEENTTTENETDVNETEDDVVLNQDPVEEDEVDEPSQTAAIKSIPTGNPLLVLMLVLMVLCSDIVRKIKK